MDELASWNLTVLRSDQPTDELPKCIRTPLANNRYLTSKDGTNGVLISGRTTWLYANPLR